MEEYKAVKDSIAMAIGGVIVFITVLWGFPTLSGNALSETNESTALMILIFVFALLVFGTRLFLCALSTLGRDFYLPGLVSMCFGTTILILMLFFGFLFSEMNDFVLEIAGTILMTGIGIMLFFKGGFYFSTHEPLASSIAEIFGFVIVLYALLFWGYSILELWRALIMIFSGFCLIFCGFYSFGAEKRYKADTVYVRV